MSFTDAELREVNEQLSNASPKEIVQWALLVANRPVLTTNFRPYEGAILHLVSRMKSDIPVVWCDTGYNTTATYQHAERLIQQLNLKVHLYVPRQSVAHRNVTMGVPNIDDPQHAMFTQQVKLEPFQRAMKEHCPDVWFTNLRKGQTAFRDSIDVVSQSKDGVLKVSPFYHWTDEDLDHYLTENEVENEFKYFDPTKVESNRECGLHS